MTFIYRLLKYVSIYLFILLPLELLGVLLGAIFFILKPDYIGPLPKYLNWYNNYHEEYPDSGWKLYYWLFIRNPLNNFQYTYFGIRCLPNTLILSIGKPVGDGLREGYEYIDYSVATNTYAFSYYYIKAYILFGKRKCVRFRLGHKLDEEVHPNKMYQWVLIFSPYTNYTGE